MNNYPFLGSGWAFPPTFTAPGASPLMHQGEPLIQQALNLILGTALGERVMRPDYGSQLARQMFGSIEATTIRQLELSVHDALLKHEPRIDLNSVKAQSGGDGCINLHIDYTVRATNTRSNMVYPFYLSEAVL
jgi:phage baseplate assembly protein W